MGGTPLFIGFTDSNWVSDSNDWKYIECYVYSIGYGLVTWACRSNKILYFLY